MRTLGIVGGIAPPSTIEYYRLVVEIHRRAAGKAPRVLINSLDGGEVLPHLAGGRPDELVDALLGALRQLASGGADLALLASVSVHVVFDEVLAESPLPLVGIAEATTAALIDVKRFGLFATRYTVEADLFGAALAPRGIAVVAPTPEEQDIIHSLYFDELVAGRFRPESGDRLVAIGARLRDEEQIDGILLGGTELPLLLPRASYDGLPYLDTARMHAEAAVAALLA